MADYVQRALIALGTVFTNRLVDSRLRGIPALAAPLYLPAIPTVQVALGLSSSIAFLYYQLREGNMVNVSTIVSNTGPASQNRLRNSWFLRNLNSYRRRCASAVRRILTPNDSLQLLRSDTRNHSINTFDSAQELRLRDSRNRRTIKRRGRTRTRRRARPIVAIDRVRQENIAQLCAGDSAGLRTLENTNRPVRTRSTSRQYASTIPIEAISKKVVRKPQQIARAPIPVPVNGLSVRKTRSGKIYGCS